MKKVCIIGLGYIGLPTAIVMAKYNFDVLGFDVNTERVNRINDYDPTIKEPEIFEKLGEALKSKKFKAVSTIQPADCFIIAVPTPFNADKTADLSYVWNAAHDIATVIKPHDLIILESTVPVGTTNKLAHLIAQKTHLKAGIDFFVAHCPERVLPGKIFYELVHNSRIVGGINAISTKHAKNIYSAFVTGPIYTTNASTAEMVKLIENSSRDVQIAFANQVHDMAAQAALDPFEVIELANKHPRVTILQPSCGVGGHCIAVDPWFLVETFPQQTALLKTARMVNDAKPLQIIDIINKRVEEWHNQTKNQCKVLLLGATYKPNIDDLRESPALAIAQQLKNNSSALFYICEPNVESSQVETLSQKKSISFQEGIDEADIIVCLVKHYDFNELRNYTDKIIIDVCGLLYQSHHAQDDTPWPTLAPYSQTNNLQTQKEG